MRGRWNGGLYTIRVPPNLKKMIEEKRERTGMSITDIVIASLYLYFRDEDENE